MTEKRQTSQGYIIRILQHIALSIYYPHFTYISHCPDLSTVDQNFTQKGKGLFAYTKFLIPITETLIV
jgi:hypothetical protein